MNFEEIILPQAGTSGVKIIIIPLGSTTWGGLCRKSLSSVCPRSNAPLGLPGRGRHTCPAAGEAEPAVQLQARHHQRVREAGVALASGPGADEDAADGRGWVVKQPDGRGMPRRGGRRSFQSCFGHELHPTVHVFTDPEGGHFHMLLPKTSQEGEESAARESGGNLTRNV